MEDTEILYTPYTEVQINHNEIPQSELDIKTKARSNLFPWKGQFSPQFIEALLSKYSKETDVVFDPFLGSGTTLYESARRKIAAFGTELNASAYYMAKVYEFVNINFYERQYIITEIEELLNSIKYESAAILSITDYIKDHEKSLEANLLCVLIILIDIYNNEIDINFLGKKWAGLKEIVLNLPWSDKPIRADMGDARSIPEDDNSATLLITSPPYINVFNYHQKYRRSVEVLGFDVLTIAKNEFGSNRKHRGNRLLTVIQYCIDMALSINESCRVCSYNSRMIYVVGRESSVLGYSFCNSQLIYELCEEIFELPFLLRQERVFKNRFGQFIYEDILHFLNSKKGKALQKEDIVSKARTIATRMLREKEKINQGSKNELYLREAIKKAGQVEESRCELC